MNKIIAEDLDFILKSNVDWDRFRNKTVFITGGYGMLLLYITFTLLQLNERFPGINVKVIALVRDKEKARERFDDFIDNKYLSIVEHDLLSSINMSEKIDYIFHGASYASPHHYRMHPVDVLLPNVIGTYHLLDLAKLKTVESFLFFSSGAVYGKNQSEVVKENDYGYLDPLDIISCYGESKRMGENMCKCWHEQFGVPAKIVRPAHIYGPTMDIENDSRVFASFVNNIVNGQNIIMRSDGSAKRSFCYIADATVANFKVILDGADGEAYNVGNDAAYVSIKELAEIFVSTLPEKQLKVIVEKKENNNYRSKGDKMLMSSKKVESLGWRCSFSIHEGVKRTVESYLIDSKEIKASCP